MNFIDTPGGSAELGDRRDVRRQLRTSSLPFYVALANLLRSDIFEGRLSAGAQLPTLDQLSERYGVAFPCLLKLNYFKYNIYILFLLGLLMCLSQRYIVVDRYFFVIIWR